MKRFTPIVIFWVLLSSLSASALPPQAPQGVGVNAVEKLDPARMVAADSVETPVVNQKLDPLLRQVLRTWTGSVARRPAEAAVEETTNAFSTIVRVERTPSGAPAVSVFIKASNVAAATEAVKDAGGTVSTIAGDIFVAQVPLEALEALANRGDVVKIEASTLAHPLLDVSRPEVHTDVVQAGTGLPRPYRGAGVVVGDVDSGLDLNHPDFRTSSGTRVRYLWDMSGTSNPPAGYGYGTECTQATINAGQCEEIDGNGGGGHGSHVTGIAAGNGRAGGGLYIGMAPEADIVFVKAARTADSSGVLTNVPDACQYIFSKAQALGEPAVINLSLGSQRGPHDGTSLYEQSLSNLTGPGRIIVAAAGNDGDSAKPIHLSYSASGSDPSTGQTTFWSIPQGTTLSMVDMWYGAGNIKVGVAAYTISAGKATLLAYTAPVSPGSSLSWTPLIAQGGQPLANVSIDAGNISDPNNSAHEVVIKINNGNGAYDLSQVVWGLYTFGSGTFDAWISPEDSGTFRWDFAGLTPADNMRTIGVPATARRVIAVGSYVTKTQWVNIDGKSWHYTNSAGLGRLSLFSSLGPTRDGRTKPDLTAPGEGIASALSQDVVIGSGVERANVLPGGMYRIDQGTSMASPHVAGVVALMLSATPNLAYDDVVSALQGTARQDATTGFGLNNRFGAGRLDALAAVKTVQPPVQPPTANFSFSPGSPTVGQAVQFTDTSTGSPTSWSWAFGDGGTFTAQNPSHTYSVAGSYPVSLTATNTAGASTVTKTVSVVGGSPGGGSTAVKVVPIVLNSAGVGTSRFSTELTLANRGNTTATVQLTYTAATFFSASGSGTLTTTLPAWQQVIIPDAIAYLRNGGLAIPADGSNQGGTLRVTFSGLSSPSVAYAGARTTTPSGTGRAGLSYPGVRPEDCFTNYAWLYGLRQNGADRSNLALVNLNPSSPITLRVNVWNANGSQGYYLTPDTTLGPGQWTQINKVLDIVGFSSGYARVDLTSGTGPFYAYAVFNDFVTGDGSYVPSLPNSYFFEPQTLPVLVETSTFSSELTLKNYTNKTASVALTYLESLNTSGGSGGTVFESLAPFEQRIIPDAIQYLRSKGMGLGPKGSGSFAGALRTTFTVAGSLDGGFVAARTSAPAATGGQYGLFFTAAGPSSAVTTEAWIFGLQQNSSVRSNLAVVNVGDASDAVTFQYEIYDGLTGHLVSTTGPFTLPPGGWTQFGTVLIPAGVTNGYARVVKLSGSSRIIAYGVVNDGASSTCCGTNDGSYIAFSNQ